MDERQWNLPAIQESYDRKRVEELAVAGLTPEQIAIRLRLDESVLSDGAFLEAVEYWRTVGLGQIATRLQEIALGEDANLKAIMFLLKALYGWRESGRTQESGDAPRGLPWDKFLIEVLPEGDE